jgi:putative ABC transport system permease protein
LTRATGRQKELAIRISIGASRFRIVRQLITEGLVIALLGGSAGLLLTYFGISLVRANLTFNEAISAVPISLDSKVLLFVLAISLISAALSSFVPAFKSAHADVNMDLKSESRTASSGRSHSRLRAVLVTGEIALALFLLTGASLLIRGVFLLDHQKLGFRTDHLLTAGLTLDPAQYSDDDHRVLFVRRLISGLQRLPGAKDVAVASDLPATDGSRVSIVLKGDPDKPVNEERSALDVVVTPEYFHTVGIPLLRGRTFSELDNRNGSRVAIINDEFVRRYLKGKDPLGVRIKKSTSSDWNEVVGVVSDVKSYSEATRVEPEIYESIFQRPVPSLAVMIRSDVEPGSLTTALRSAVAELDRDLPLARVMTMDAVIDYQRSGNPFFTRVLGSFALLALILAAIGIYGLVAYSVGQRTHEIGIRMVVGAKTSDVLRMILRDGFKTAAIGSAVGLVLALPLPKLFDAIFEGVHFAAPGLYLIVLTAILAVAVFATYVPAFRAARIDPKTALREQ